MPSSKYPLKPLLEHREQKVEAAMAELGSAVRLREAADAVRTRAEIDQRAEEERAAIVRAEEAKRLARGELRVADLAQAQVWEIAARAQMDELTRGVEEAKQKLDHARQEEADARAGLARVMADRDVVAKDAARFEARARTRVIAAEEEAAEEAFRGGR